MKQEPGGDVGDSIGRMIAEAPDRRSWRHLTTLERQLGDASPALDPRFDVGPRCQWIRQVFARTPTQCFVLLNRALGRTGVGCR